MPRRLILLKALGINAQCLFYLLLSGGVLNAQEPPDLLSLDPSQDLDQAIPFKVEKPLPVADELIAKVKERLALNAVQLRADLKTKFADGSSQSLSANMWIDWNVDNPYLRYLIEDGFGAPQEELSVYLNYEGSAKISTSYTNFNEVVKTDDFSIHQAIEGLGMAWSDLMFAYLWWPNPKAIDRVERKTRDCVIIDLFKPKGNEAPYDRVRLWIDEKEFFVIQASAFNVTGELMREIEGKSLKKFNGNWMIKDIEIKTFPDKTKTKVLVRDVEAFDEE